MLNKANIFNIPANYHFFESLADWLIKNFAHDLSSVKIFLPNHRSCRELKKILLKKEIHSFLPQIKAISDISYEDFFDFLPNEEVKEIIDEILEIKVLSKGDSLLFLAKKIQELTVFGSDLNLVQALKIADNLFNLFEEIEREELDLAKLDEIDDSNLSKHRLITLDFLQEFHVGIKNYLLRNNLLFPSAAQNLIISKFNHVIQKFAGKTKIVIAGSTGSISSTRKLIKAISKNNHVILHGFGGEFFSEENHPQFLLNQLLEFLEIESKNISQIRNNKFLLSKEDRQNLIKLSMLPSNKCQAWQDIESFVDKKEVVADLQENFQLITANDEVTEAHVIALIARDNFLQNKTTAIIGNNDKISDLINLELARLNLDFNDSRNFSIFRSKLINFLLLILEVKKSDFNSYDLLALIKNPFCKFSNQGELIAEFEINILRQDRISEGYEGIKSKLKNNQVLDKFFAEIIGCFQSESSSNLAAQSNLLIKIAENLSEKNWHQLLENEEAQNEIFEFFEFLKSQKNIDLKKEDLSAIFKSLLSQISYVKKSDSDSKIQILSTVEARLLNFDLVIISSLNEGDFPQVASDNWLGKKVRKDLGIEKVLRKTGQNAYDFCNYLSNKSVILTRSKTLNSVDLIESPFLAKLRTVCKKIEINFHDGKKYFDEISQLHRVERVRILPPNPKPNLEDRPKRISVTDISKLIANPYEIYAKKILQLKKLQEIDFGGSYSEFGSFIHKALENFVKENKTQDFEEIFKKYFLSQEAKLIWLPKFQKIFEQFLQDNQEFEGFKNFCEVAAEINFADVTISGKIDRVVISEDKKISILDYKTGQIPTAKSVKLGLNPQLTIAALMLYEGLVSDIKSGQIATIGYWKLSSSNQGKISKITKNEEESEPLILAAKSGLEKIITYFSNQNNGYIATDSNEKSDYKNLSRFDEWGSFVDEVV